MTMLYRAYRSLLEEYGPRGWWPLLETGYHPGDYSYPHSSSQRFQIAVGAILTQNTAWGNARNSLETLWETGLNSPESIWEADIASIETAIRTSGYWRVKARKLKEYADFTLALGERQPSRAELLGVWGIGPETADDILLYAWKEPICVIDTYTKRFFATHSLAADGATYHEIQQICHRDLPLDIPTLQEFHALMVQWGKANKKPGSLSSRA